MKEDGWEGWNEGRIRWTRSVKWKGERKGIKRGGVEWMCGRKERWKKGGELFHKRNVWTRSPDIIGNQDLLGIIFTSRNFRFHSSTNVVSY